jgi:predicted transcriptional regulator
MDKALSLNDVVSELTAIKRLLTFRLLKEGVSQEEVANALGTSQSSVSRMFPPFNGKRPRARGVSADQEQ